MSYPIIVLMSDELIVLLIKHIQIVKKEFDALTKQPMLQKLVVLAENRAEWGAREGETGFELQNASQAVYST